MDDNRNDNFGDFLRSRLNDDSPGENQWNVPPDFVFEGAMATIQQEKDKRKRRFLWLLLPFGLLIGIGGFAWYANTSLSGMEDRLQKVESYQEQALTEIPKVVKNEIASLQQKIEENAQQYTANNHENTAENNIKDGVEIPGITVDRNTPQAGNQTNKSIVNSTNWQAEVGIVESSIEENTSSKVQHQNGVTTAPKAVDVPNLLAISPLTVITTPDKDLPGNVEISVPSKAKDSGYWSLGIYGNTNSATLAMNNIPSDRQNVLKEYDKNYGGFGLGLQSFYHTPGRWSFGVEAGYNCFHNESSLQEPMQYDKDQETTNPQGLTTYETALNIGTPLGDYSYAANFRVGGNIQDEAPLMNKTAIAQTLHTAHFGALARYQVIKKERWNWYLGAGVGTDVIFKKENLLATELYYGSQMMFENDMKVNHLENEVTSYYSVVAETGLEYMLDKQFSLLLQGQYNNSFTNLRSNQNGGSTSTYLKDLSLGLGLRMRL